MTKYRAALVPGGGGRSLLQYEMHGCVLVVKRKEKKDAQIERVTI